MTLIEAIQANNEKVFFELLNSRVSPPGKRIIDEVDAECAGNALYWAAAGGHLHFIEPLINAGVNVNKANNLGWTPVYAAAHFGYTEIITALKAGGAHANTPNDSGTPPVCAAAYGGHVKAIIALKAAGADVDATEVNGLTPLYIAVQMGDVTVINALLEAGANVSTKTPQGTPLELAKRDGTQKGRYIVTLLETHLQQYPNTIKILVANSEAASLNQELYSEDFVKTAPRYGNLTVVAEAGRDVNTLSDGIRAQGQVVVGGGNMSNVAGAGHKSSSDNPRKVVEVDNLAVLKQLKLFFMSSKYKGPESQDCELYNKVLAVHRAELVYDIDAHVHKLFINDNPLEAQDAIKVLRKMMLSLQSLNTQNTSGLTLEAKADRDVNTVLGGIRAEGQVVIGGGNISNATEIGNGSNIVPRKVVEVDDVAILKQLKIFFMSSKYKGSESQDCELYNSVLAIHNGDLVYDVEERAYRLFVNDEPVEPRNAPTLTKIIASLQPLNTHRTGFNTASSGNALLQAHAGRDVITITGSVTSGGEVRIGGGDMNHNLRAYNQFRDQTAGQYNMTSSENVRFDNGSLKNNQTNTWR